MTQPIRGKVAQVLSPKEIVMNIGAADDVIIGMLFNVVETTTIKDPDTSRILGKVERPKLKVKVVEVQEQLSVASTLGGFLIVEKAGTFASSLLSDHKAFVRIGDVVVHGNDSIKI